jgi:Nucleotidyltransferase domain
MSTRHLYIFGSMARGDFDCHSDVDLLYVVSGIHAKLDLNKYSIYSHNRLKILWSDGNPFAWHLHSESKLVFSSDGVDFLLSLGIPNKYQNAKSDCLKFVSLLDGANVALQTFSHNCQEFELSTAFLAFRNFASCLALHQGRQDFSRNSARNILRDQMPIAIEAYNILEKSKLLCTRGLGENLTKHELKVGIAAIPELLAWMLASVPE